jgi:hypothetical protein
MSRISKGRPQPSSPDPSRDDPAQSERFIATAREVEAETTAEMFEQAFQKVAFGRLDHHRPKRKRRRRPQS